MKKLYVKVHSGFKSLRLADGEGNFVGLSVIKNRDIANLVNLALEYYFENRPKEIGEDAFYDEILNALTKRASKVRKELIKQVIEEFFSRTSESGREQAEEDETETVEQEGGKPEQSKKTEQVREEEQRPEQKRNVSGFPLPDSIVSLALNKTRQDK